MSRLLVLVFALVTLGACGKARLENNNATADCADDRDCAGDKVCRASLCTVAERSPRALGFRLVPAPASTYPAQSVAIHEVPADQPIQIGLDPGVRVAGALRFVGLETGPDNGRLKFRRRGDDFTAEAAVTNSEYEAYVPAGTYEITFFPADAERRPTRVWPEVEIELDTDPKLQLPERTVQVIGTLSRTDAVSRESQFVTHARVFATSAESGVTSSVATTDESGNFSIAVPEDSGSFDLHVTPLEPNSYVEGQDAAAYVPDATFNEAFIVEGTEWKDLLDENEGADVLGVSLGEYGYAPISIPVRLEVDAAVADWTGTSVTLRTTAGRGVISIRQRLGESGEFEIPLIVGLYDAIVRTPPTLPVRSMELSGIEITNSGIVLKLEPRGNVRGSVEGPDGAPLAGAELRFVPTGEGGLTQTVSVTTDEDGFYEAWLDSASYVLTVVPTDPSLPRYLAFIEDADVPDPIRISEPVLVWGTVFGTPSDADEWRGVADVSVHVIEADADDRVRVIGEAQTNEQGDFKTVIGARP